MSGESPCRRRDGATKNDYPSHHAAKKAAKALQGRVGVRMVPYHCPRCREYHLTSGGR